MRPRVVLVLALALGPGAALGLAPRDRPSASPAPGAGTWKTIDLVGATCGEAAPGPLTFRIPPGYVVRSSAKGLTAGCLWGTPADLALVLGEGEATFDRVERGVFRARLTTTVAFDVASEKFAEEERLPELFSRAGVAGVSVVKRALGGAPALVVSGRGPNGAPLYLLYLAIRRAGSADVLLISFQAPANGDVSETWRRFLTSIRAEK